MKILINTLEMTLSQMHGALDACALDMAQALVDLKLARQVGTAAHFAGCEDRFADCQQVLSDYAQAIALRSQENAFLYEVGADDVHDVPGALKVAAGGRKLTLYRPLGHGVLEVLGNVRRLCYLRRTLSDGHNDEVASLQAYLSDEIHFDAVLEIDGELAGTWAV